MTNHATRDADAAFSIATIEPEQILPSQFFDRPAAAALQPEKRLMLAVLEDAVATFQKYALATTGPGARLFRETDDWLRSRDEQWPFAYRNLCSALGLDPDRLVRGLDTWRDARRAGRTPAVLASPFRRINGSRHKATGRPVGLGRLRDVA